MNSHYAMKPEAVAILSAEDKQGILAGLADLMARAWDLDAAVVLEHLEEREKLGSTGFGRSVAGLIRLTRPVNFASADGMPVDLVFGLLSPEQCGAMHLHALASISRLMRDERVHEAMVEAPDADAIYSLLANAMDQNAA